MLKRLTEIFQLLFVIFQLLVTRAQLAANDGCLMQSDCFVKGTLR